jgi:thioester reductase-like protein
VVCLVRAQNDEVALRRVREALAGQGLSPDTAFGRLRAVAGDVAKPFFGLSDSAFSELGDRIDRIYHCAAQINLIFPYRAVRATNVLGTLEALRLAALGSAKSFHHVSTAAVYGSPQEGGTDEIPESFRVDLVAGLEPGYAKSKWVAEQLVNVAAENGLAAAIYRPGLITGHSRTGACNRRDSFSLLLRACIVIGLAPDIEGGVYMSPVDFVARAIVELSQNAQSCGKAFHLVNARRLSYRDIADALHEGGYVTRTVPYVEWVRAIRKRAEANPEQGLSFLMALLSESPPAEGSGRQRFSAANTLAGLARLADAGYPEDGRPLIRQYLAWLARDGQAAVVGDRA